MRFFSLIVLLCGCATYAAAQIDIEVTAIDPAQGKAVAEAPIMLTNAEMGFTRSKTTNEQGKARFQVPVAGVYRITLTEGSGLNLLDTASVTVRNRQSASVSVFVLPELSEQTLAEVVVSGGASYSPTKLNAINAEVSSTLSQAELTALPVEGRDVTQSLYRMPNVSQATGFFPEAPNVAINGANSLFTNYLIDGMDNNENFLGGQRFAIPVGFARDISVLTNNYGTEYGLTANGIVNVTTRSGSNELHGEAFYVWRPGPLLDEPSAFAQRDLSGNQVKDGFQRHQFGFGLGGPIVKDKTFFYVNAEQTLDLKDNLLNAPDLGVNETVQGQNSFTYLSGKIDHFWSDRLHSALRVNAGFVAIERQGGGLEGGVTFPSAGNDQRRNSLNVALQNAYEGDRFTLQSNYQYSRFGWNYADPANEGSPNVTVLGPDDLTVAVLGHPGFVFEEIENTFQMQQKLTYYLDKHTLKAGFLLKSSGYELFGGGNPNGSYTVRLTEAQLADLQGVGSGFDVGDLPADVAVTNYGVELRPNSFTHTQNIYSFYIEDRISLSRKLNVSLGLRYDYDDLSEGGSSEGDYDNIAPRLNVNYQLDPRSVVRFGYGIYYEKILYAVYSDALQFNTNSADYKAQLAELQRQGLLDPGADLDKITNDGNLTAFFSDNVTYLQGPSAESLQEQRGTAFSNELRVLNPDGYQNPFAHQFTLGYQRQLNENTLFSVDLMHNRSFNLFRLRNLNAPAEFDYDQPLESFDVRTVEEADLTRPVPIQPGGFAVVNGDTLRGIARNVVMSETEGASEYTAMTLTLNKDKGRDKFSYRLSYTLSLLENNTEDINFRAMNSNNYDEEWGPSINDRTHIINGFFTYYPMKGLSLTMAALLQSGQPINRIPDAGFFGTTDLNGDGRAFSDAYQGNSDRAPGRSRNDDRLPWSQAFDASAMYQYDFGGGHRAVFRVDVFNLFDAENLSGYANNATQSNQIQPAVIGTPNTIQARNAAPPRQYQFTLQYLF